MGIKLTVTVVDCDFSDSRRNGVEIQAKGCKVFVKRCRLSGHKRYGLMCLNGSVVADHTHSTRNRQGGYRMEETGNMQLLQCSSDKDAKFSLEHFSCVATIRAAVFLQL